MNGHHDEQEALFRERALRVSGNNSVHHQEVQNIKNKKKMFQLMNSQNKKQHQHMSKMIPWEKKQLIYGKQKILQMTISWLNRQHASISASTPWVLYEAGIVCSRNEDGQIEKNSSGEKIVVLREWGRLLGPQRVALRWQSIGRAEWEKLPWTGPLCYLFTRSWEIGRLRSHYKKAGNINLVRERLDECRYYHTDWMRGAGEPLGWDERFDID